jgi:MarR family transcriptional regulator, organic hydroperoxide resistance regulator
VIAAWQRTTHRLLAAVDAELADLRLSAGEVNALAALADGAGTARELADATAQRPSTLTGVLDRLERHGLVARRPNPRDRRSSLIEPTAQGRVHAARVQEAFAAVEARIAVPRDDVAAVLAAIDAALGPSADPGPGPA